MKLFIILLLSMSTLYSQEKEKIVSLITKDAEVVVLEKKGDLTKVQVTQWVNLTTSKVEKAVTFAKTKFVMAEQDYGRSAKPYRRHIKLFYSFVNDTQKVIVGIKYTVKYMDSFGDVVLTQSYKDEVLVKPGDNSANGTYWYLEDGLGGYRKISTSVGLGTTKYTIKVTQIAFKDGSVMK